MAYKFISLEENIYAITDKNLYTAYLIIGEDRAMLIDTAAGIGDIKAEISSYSDKPLIVVNSHAHPDHCGGNCLFDTVYASQRTKDMLLSYGYYPANRPEDSTITLQKVNDQDTASIDIGYELSVIDETTEFDLGGCTIQCFDTPGHTGGCMSFYLKEKKYLFSADFAKPGVWAFLDDSDLYAYKNSLEKICMLDILKIYGGHIFDEQPKQLLTDLLLCINDIIKNPDIGTKTTTRFDDNVYLHKNGLGEIIYHK